MHQRGQQQEFLQQRQPLCQLQLGFLLYSHLWLTQPCRSSSRPASLQHKPAMARVAVLRRPSALLLVVLLLRLLVLVVLALLLCTMAGASRC